MNNILKQAAHEATKKTIYAVLIAAIIIFLMELIK
jgi:hypothetical protein